MDKYREEPSPLDELKKFITECGYKNGFVDMLGDADKHPQGVQAHIQQIMDGLSQKAQQKKAAGDGYPALLIDRTKVRLSLMLARAWEASSKAFEGKSGSIENPQAFFPLAVKK